MQIQEVTDLFLALPTDVQHLMPTMDEIPADFKRWRGNAWARFVAQWFFQGADSSVLVPKQGISKAKALRHVTAIMRSFEPKQEHKEAAVAFLLSQWFEPLQ